jgi:hypothetical protein
MLKRARVMVKQRLPPMTASMGRVKLQARGRSSLRRLFHGSYPIILERLRLSMTMIPTQ